MSMLFDYTKGENVMVHRKMVLDEEEMPKQWYNILPDLPKPFPPVIDPKTKSPGAGHRSSDIS